jgi:AcrR family transcriptional regulator
MGSAPRSPFQAAARDLLRTTLLESARELLRTRSWTEITMADISTSAGVSRQTLYNEFGSRAQFVEAYLFYDADRILTAVEQAITAAGDDPAEALEQAFRVFMETIIEDPLAVTVLSGNDPDNLLTLVTTRGAPVLQVAAMRLGGAIQASWPQADPADVTLLAEELVRLALSHAMLRSADPAEAAAGVSKLLTPFAEIALSTAPARRG